MKVENECDIKGERKNHSSPYKQRRPPEQLAAAPWVAVDGGPRAHTHTHPHTVHTQ